VAAVAMLAVAVGCVMLQGGFPLYHWSTMFPICALMIAIGLASAARDGSAGARALVTACILALVYQTALRPAAYLVGWGGYVVGLRTAAQYYGSFGERQWVNPADAMATAEFLRERTAPSEPVVNFGPDATIPFLANRLPVARFGWSGPLLNAPHSALTREYRREFIDAVETKRPPYVVFSDLHGHLQGAYRRLSLDREFPEFAAVLAHGYVYDRRIGSVEVFRRRDYQPPAPGSTGASRAVVAAR
jgi:hypothetical protein